jgi:hypothetical protein
MFLLVHDNRENMALYDRLADLPVTIEDYTFELKERDTSSGFARTTTIIELHGDDETGYGEDVTYDNDEHYALIEEAPEFPLTGEYTHHEFSEMVGDLDLFYGRDGNPVFRDYRRWGFESAALDLALKQDGTNLAAVLDRSYNPVRFVASTRLGDNDSEPSLDRIEAFLDYNSDLEFKLDPTSDWSDELVDQLAETERVRILDLKGHYHDTTVDQSADPELYRRIIDGFPSAIIEDPAFTNETRSLFDGHEERVSWDAPIHGIETIENLPFEPSVLNIKPSRFGSVESLLDTIEYCLNGDITMYGGGQFELGVGREHIHTIASLFYPSTPNDVAPKAYNDPEVTDTLPKSPLSPPSDPSGLHWN